MLLISATEKIYTNNTSPKPWSQTIDQKSAIQKKAKAKDIASVVTDYNGKVA